MSPGAASFDVLIAGAGPAGRAAAAACAAEGMRVGLLAPDPDARWVPTYAAWGDDVVDGVPFDVSWPEVAVRLGEDELRIRRRYGRLDSERLREGLLQRSAGVEVLRGAIVSVGDPGGAGTAVRDDRGRVHRAAVVIDATGASRASAYQTAHGIVAEVSGLSDRTPRWMDFSHRFSDGGEVPSFLYALPLPDGTWLLEETVLVRAPAFPHARLERRLWRRLAAEGIAVQRVLATERCAIPMDTWPQRSGALVRFGAAAGMVHPATGYLVPRVLAAAPRLARAIARGLDVSPVRASLLARAALWPEDALRRHGLYRYASGAVARLGADDTRTFFRVFFSMPQPFVEGFLGDRLSAPEVVGGMASLFARLSNRLRLRLLAAGDPIELLRAVLSAASVPPELEATP